MFYSMRTFRTSSPGDSISSEPERSALRRQGEEPGYTDVLEQGAGGLNIKRLLLIKENQISQGKEFSTFLCGGRVWARGTHSFSAPLGQDPVPFRVLSSLGPHCGDWLWPDGSEIAAIFLLSQSPKAPRPTLEGCNHR